MKKVNQINMYFEEIKDDMNFTDIMLVESLSNKDKVQLYEYLKNNGALYAGGEISEGDIVKVRNVMINLWLKATENNKKYGQKKA